MRILAPHKEQDGWVYVRVRRSQQRGLAKLRRLLGWACYPTDIATMTGETATLSKAVAVYTDVRPEHRIISSHRVEEAVETADFLKLCADEGLHATFRSGGCWMVGKNVLLDATVQPELIRDEYRPVAFGYTLREAYYRYKAVAR